MRQLFSHLAVHRPSVPGACLVFGLVAACQGVGAGGFATSDLTTLDTATVLAPLGFTPFTTDRRFLTMACTACAGDTQLALRLREDFADSETGIRTGTITQESLLGSCTGTVQCLRADTQTGDGYAFTYLVRDQVDWIAASVDIYAGGDALQVEVIGPDVDEVSRLASEAAALLLPVLFE